jgi:hypothetical protein
MRPRLASATASPLFLDPRLLARLLPLSLTFFLLAACDQIAPPLEQLPLRDTLRADPEVVAALSDGARQNLGDRLLSARRAESASDLIDDPAAPPPEVLARFDRARERSGREARPRRRRSWSRVRWSGARRARCGC